MLQHVVDAVLAIRRPKEAIDLHMVEMMEMQHKTDMDTSWVAYDENVQLVDFWKCICSCTILRHVIDMCIDVANALFLVLTSSVII